MWHYQNMLNHTQYCFKKLILTSVMLLIAGCGEPMIPIERPYSDARKSITPGKTSRDDVHRLLKSPTRTFDNGHVELHITSREAICWFVFMPIPCAGDDTIPFHVLIAYDESGLVHEIDWDSRGILRAGKYGYHRLWDKFLISKDGEWIEEKRHNLYADVEFYPKDYLLTENNICIKADEGNADAQAYIGDLYNIGAYSLNKDHIQAYVWFSFAAKNGNRYAVHQVEKLEADLSPTQLIEARSQLKHWEPGQCKQGFLKAVSGESE